jgi:hypothetical protein
MPKVFLSYSHKDARWLDKLRVDLGPLEREGEIGAWDDKRIKPGMDWLKEIESTLAPARVSGAFGERRLSGVGVCWPLAKLRSADAEEYLVTVSREISKLMSDAKSSEAVPASATPRRGHRNAIFELKH